jgi:alkanesulfonate monooxygenase SsuD/methylene tetrahydromethanopterin reductase-like flavin-dependent oxidoreductase (luciferase family)
MVMSAAQIVVCGRDEAEIAKRAAAIGREVGELRENGLCGTPDELLGRLQTWGAAGASRIYLQIMDLLDLEHLQLIADSVLPHVGQF